MHGKIKDLAILAQHTNAKDHTDTSIRWFRYSRTRSDRRKQKYATQNHEHMHMHQASNSRSTQLHLHVQTHDPAMVRRFEYSTGSLPFCVILF